ncbi:MAG: CDP-glycerol glycerophosphotransferase family protein [Parasporobacterium sp.]|nr:CDP-glycerol glycerophosphotransferase family protein [Parasporobacterium sp.]
MNKLVIAIIEGKFFGKCGKKIKKAWKKGVKAVDFTLSKPLRNRYVRQHPIVKNRITLMAVDNRYDCNPKYIAEEILRRKLDVELFWIRKADKNEMPPVFPSSVTVVKYNTIEAIEALATSKIWIENELKFLKPYTVHKKKGQYYMQTWHGSMGFKKIGRENLYNLEGRKKRFINRIAALCDKTTDFCISNSDFETDVFRKAYWDTTPILEYGHARNDILFNKNPEEVLKLKERVLAQLTDDFSNGKAVSEEEKEKNRKELLNTRYLMYAPTYRKDQNISNFDIDFFMLTKVLHEQFGGNWKILFRFHQHNRNLNIKSSKFINATMYPDMQELMAIADAGVSDYSSWLCDFVLTGRPAFIYAPDYEFYANDRGFYYPLDTTPFPICINNAELKAAVSNFNEEKYAEKCREFLEARGCFEKGNAAERIVDKIEELMNK